MLITKQLLDNSKFYHGHENDLTIGKSASTITFRGETFFVPGTGLNFSTAYGFGLQADGSVIMASEDSSWNGVETGYGIQKVSATGELDATFTTNTGTGFDSDGLCVAMQNDDKILIGGYFSEFNGTTTNGFTRLNADGTLDTDFNTAIGTACGVGNYANCIAKSESGEIFVGGWFDDFNGNSSSHFVKLNSDGTQDTSFMTNLGSGFDSEVSAICIQEDGKIVVGGYFEAVNSTPALGIARLNSDGSVDTTFSANIVTGSSGGYFRGILQQSSGKLIIGGEFSTFEGHTGRIHRLNEDGTYDTTFSSGTGFDNDINAMKLTEGDKILVAGSFQNYNGTATKYLCKLSADGIHELNFGDSLDSQIYSYTIIENSDGFIYAGTYATDVNLNNPGVFRFKSNGEVNIGTIPVIDQIIIGGSAAIYDADYSENYVDRSLVDKAWVISQGETASNGLVRTVNTGGTGNFGLGGTLEGHTEINIASSRLQLQNYGMGLFFDVESGFNIGLGGNSGYVSQTKVIDPQFPSDGAYKVIVVGNFTSWNTDLTKKYITVLIENGTNSGDFNPASINNTIRAVDVQQDGKIIIGGDFTQIDGNTVNRIARLNSDGSYDATFSGGTGFNGSVYSIFVQDDDKILVGGTFTEFDGTSAWSIVRLNENGGVDTGFTYGSGFRWGGAGGTANSWVERVFQLSGGSIYACGAYNYYDGVFSPGFTKLNSDGSRVAGFNVLSDGERGMWFDVNQETGEVIIARFNNPRLKLITSGGTNVGSFDPGTGFTYTFHIPSTEVSKVCWLPNGTILASGAFNRYNGNNLSDENGQGGNLINLNIDGTINHDFKLGYGGGSISLTGGFVSLLPENKILLNGYTYHDPKTLNTGLYRLDENGLLDAGKLVMRNAVIEYNENLHELYTARSIPDVAYVTGITSTLTGGSTSILVGNGLTDNNGVIILGGSLSGDTSLDSTSLSHSSTVTFGNSAFNAALSVTTEYDDGFTMGSTSFEVKHFNGTTISFDDLTDKYNEFKVRSSGIEATANGNNFGRYAHLDVSNANQYDKPDEQPQVLQQIIEDDGTANDVLFSPYGFDVTFRNNDDDELARFIITKTGTTFTDGRAIKAGIEYKGNYATGFTKHSLVDVNYVTGITSQITPTLVVFSGSVAGNVVVDLTTADIFLLNVTGNVTSFNYTGETIGKQYMFKIIMDTSNKSFTWASGRYRFPFGTTPVLTNPTTNGSSPAHSEDIITAICMNGGRLDVVTTPDMQSN